MPTGQAPLKVILRVVEAGRVENKDINTIIDRLHELFDERSGWRTTFIEGGLEHEIHFKHRGSTIPTDYTEATICSNEICNLAKALCDPKSKLSLAKVTKNITTIKYMPYALNQSNFQKLFNRQLVLATLKSTAEKALFKDVEVEDKKAESFLRRNSQKWLLGPLHVGVFLSDFLILFGNFASLLPLNDAMGEMLGSELSEDRVKALVQLLIYWSEFASSIRNACSVIIGNLDKNKIENDLIEADGNIREAMGKACDQLQTFVDKMSASPSMIAAGGHDEILTINRKLAESVEAAQKALIAVTEESDRRLGGVLWCFFGGLAIMTAGVSVGILGPAASGLLAIEVVGGFLAADCVGLTGVVAGAGLTIFGSALNGKQMLDANKYKKELDNIRMRSYEIYTFLALVVLRRLGKLPDDDERFIMFSLNMAKIFEGVDVLDDWAKPEYIRHRVNQEVRHLKTCLERLRRPPSTGKPQSKDGQDV